MAAPLPRRRNIALLSQHGVTLLGRHNPCIVLWWSAAFPGFGHLLLNLHLRGMLFTLMEVFINSQAHINEAMVYSFCGRFDLAADIIDPTWVYGYMFFFFYAIWDSYRRSLENNMQRQLAEMENARIPNFYIGKYCIQYLTVKSPVAASLCSLAFPGLGQLYSYRIDVAFCAIIWWWFCVSHSHLYDAVLALFNGRLESSSQALVPHWLLFMPSVCGGAVFHANSVTRDMNQLFRQEMRQYLNERYQSPQSESLLFGEPGPLPAPR